MIQDVRGRYTSEGEWYPFKHEIDDGYDTVEWAAALPHSNGKVGMFGGSYVGATQMLAAISHPPHLAGICPVVTASNYHENWTYQGGAFEQWFDESWTAGLAQDTAQSPDPRRTPMRWSATACLPLNEYPVFNIKPITGGIAVDARTCALFPRLARASHVRQLLETVVDRGELSRTSRFPRSPSRPGTTCSRAARCATTWGSGRTPETRPRATASI